MLKQIPYCREITQWHNDQSVDVELLWICTEQARTDPMGFFIFIWTNDNEGLFANFSNTSPERLFRASLVLVQSHSFHFKFTLRLILLKKPIFFCTYSQHVGPWSTNHRSNTSSLLLFRFYHPQYEASPDFHQLLLSIADFVFWMLNFTKPPLHIFQISEEFAWKKFKIRCTDWFHFS